MHKKVQLFGVGTADSKIAITKAMGTSDVLEWDLESITKRDIRISDEIVAILDRWNKAYLNVPADEMKEEKPSEDQLAQIEKFKKKGLDIVKSRRRLFWQRKKMK